MLNRKICCVFLVLSVFFFQGCSDVETLDEVKVQKAIEPFAAKTEFNDIQKILLFEYITNGKTYLSYSELKNDYGNVQSLTDENIVGVQSSFSDGKLFIYFDVKSIGKSMSVHGHILSEERLEELRKLVE